MLFRSEYARPFDEGILDRRLALLEQYVTYFEEQGIKVLFFEMPIRSDLRNLQR